MLAVSRGSEGSGELRAHNLERSQVSGFERPAKSGDQTGFGVQP